MDTELRHLEIVGFIDCSFREIVALFGPPAEIRGCSGWLYRWNGREFLITDGDPPSHTVKGDYSFTVSAGDRAAGRSFALYLAEILDCVRLTRGIATV